MNSKTIDPDGDYYIAEMESAIREVRNHRFPSLIVGEDDDNEKVFLCPGCKQEVKEDHLLAVHNGTRKTVLFTPEEEDWDDEQLWGNPTNFSASDFGQFQVPLYYVHFTCETRVSLPDGWRLAQQ